MKDPKVASTASRRPRTSYDRRIDDETTPGPEDGSRPSQEHVLTIDVGTSGPKCAVFTLDGAFVAAEFEPVELLLDAGGFAEQRPQDWWSGIVAATTRLLDSGAVDRRDYGSICSGGVALLVDQTEPSSANCAPRSARHSPERNALIEQF